MAFHRILLRGNLLKRSLGVRYRADAFARNIKFSEEVLQAKLDKHPLVALESTIITHGMPYPENLKTAMQVENIVRREVSCHLVYDVFTNLHRYI